MIHPIYISNSRTETGEPAATLSGQISTLMEAEQALIEINGLRTRFLRAAQSDQFLNVMRRNGYVGRWVRDRESENRRDEERRKS